MRVVGHVQGVGFRDAVRRRARELGVTGWVRNVEDGGVAVHVEGPSSAVEEILSFLHKGPSGATVAKVEPEEVPIEGHEQFAVRGVSAGVFIVQEHQATSHHFDLRLQVVAEQPASAISGRTLQQIQGLALSPGPGSEHLK